MQKSDFQLWCQRISAKALSKRKELDLAGIQVIASRDDLEFPGLVERSA
jgi:hypothetical protein